MLWGAEGSCFLITRQNWLNTLFQEKKLFYMSSRDITFAVDNLTKVFRIKKSDDLELSKGSGGIPHCEAYRCSSCKKILIDYANR